MQWFFLISAVVMVAFSLMSLYEDKKKNVVRKKIIALLVFGILVMIIGIKMMNEF